MSPVVPRLLAASVSSLLALACGESPAPGATSDASADSSALPAGVTPTAALPTEANKAHTLTVVVRDQAGKPWPNQTITFAAQPGSGKVAPASATSDGKGQATVTWTTGPAPIVQTLRATVATLPAADLAGPMALTQPLEPAPFGKVATWLADHKVDGSTEDMAISPDGSYAMLGVPGHLLRLDPSGDVTEIAATGDAFTFPLGMQFAGDGSLLFCDSTGKALRKLTKDKVVATLTTTDGSKPLEQPNDLVLDDKGRVWFTDPCLGEVLRYDPATKATQVLATFDLGTQGGPNGIALSPDGKHVVVATENVTVLCFKGGAALDAPLGRLWQADRTDGKLTFNPRGDAQGVFGDGCAYDQLGNLYATFDQFVTKPTIALQASVVVVYRKGETQPQPFLSTDKALFANVVFGRGAMGAEQLYTVLLTVPPVTPPEARGVWRIETGVPGL